MTNRLSVAFISFLLIFSTITSSFGQTDSAIGQVSSSEFESFAGGISGNGRFIVFESSGDIATENPRNSDHNTEIFLFDYAQRRIFQITDTQSVLFDTTKPNSFSNVRVTIVNTRPVISNDGKWIAFSSNATTARPSAPNNTNPGQFDGNAYTSPTPTPSPSPTPTATPTASPSPTATPTPGANPLTADGNLEMWLYQIPAYPDVASLSTGDEIPFTDLAGGTFIRITNTDASQLPRAGTATTGPFIAEDNHDPSLSDNGNVLAFTSTRDLVPAIGNPYPAEDNDEIFTYVRSTGLVNQVTKTPRGTVSDPIYNKNPVISGNGLRVAFTSTGDNPIVGMTGGNNPSTSRNEEIFYSDLDATGAPTGTKKQVTVTDPGLLRDPVNIFDRGQRMSRDGRYIAFDSYADLAAENNGTRYLSFALYVYDTTTQTFRRVGPRSDADTGALGGDVQHYPTFTDYNAQGVPQTMLFETRENITSTGSIPTNAADGLNPSAVRPSQIYAYTIGQPPATATFARLANFPAPQTFIASTQPLASNTSQRTGFNLALTELGGANFDNLSEVFYLLIPTATATTPATVSLITGASGRPVLPTGTPSPTPVASPTPTATPTASPTPTPTPSPSPTATPSGSPTPTPVTPATVPGVSAGMLAVLTYQSADDRPIVPRTAVGSFSRSFNLPIELSGVSLSIGGAAAGIRSVSQRTIEFVVPPGLESLSTGTVYPLVINNNGLVMKSFITVVSAQPDLFNMEGIRGPGGRAKLFNVTNTVFTTEPFAIRTIKRKGNRLVPSVIRVYLTGVYNVASTAISVRIGDVTVLGVKTNAVPFEPGIQTFDFELPSTLQGAGDKPVVVSVTVNGVTYTSRLDDTAPRTSIL